MKKDVARFHLPGLFEFYEFYKVFLPLFFEHREFFYDFCEIGSLYGAPADALWGGGRVGFGDDDETKVFKLIRDYGIPAELTFSNSLLREEHLSDRNCNRLCAMLSENDGIIVCSDLLVRYLQDRYPLLALTSSTTKVLTDFDDFRRELARPEFRYAVPDFRLNICRKELAALSDAEKEKVEFLCNECCLFECTQRKTCYENVSRKVLGEPCEDHVCRSPHAKEGYVFSRAMQNPGFIGMNDIRDFFLPAGFSEFKIEGRSLGSALLLEFILYYMTKPEYALQVREHIYLDHSLDLF